jgi:predicted PurR-regulated permease PerM
VALAGLLLWAAYIARGALLLIYASMLLAVGFSPLVRLIERQKLLPIGSRRAPRWLAILVIYVAILGSLTALGFLIVPPLTRQARELWSELPAMLDRGQRLLLEYGLIDHPLTVQELFQSAPGDTGDVVAPVVGALWSVMGGIFGVFAILILTFYILIEAHPLFDRFLCLVPPAERPRIATLSREITVRVSAWLMGQLILGITIASTAAIGLWLLGVPYFYVLALMAGIGELIPVIGPLLAALPAVAVAATQSWNVALFVVIFFVLQQQFENHVLVPKVMERQVGISAVTVIVALLLGGSLLGIVGAILAIPTAAIVIVLFDELVGAANVPPAGENRSPEGDQIGN